MPSRSKKDITIVYVSNTRLPTEKAHGLALIKLCEAFHNSGYGVEVVTPWLWRASKKDVYSYYGVPSVFPVRYVPTIDLVPFPLLRRLTFLLQMVSFSFVAAIYCFFKYRNRNDVIYFSHDYMPLSFLSILSQPIFYDIHHFPGKNSLYRRVMRRSVGFSVQTKWKVSALHDQFGVPEYRIAYWPNGTDVGKFSITTSRDEARATLGITSPYPLVLYTGQLFTWKGVETLVRAVPYLPEKITVGIVGGDQEDRDRILREEGAHDPRVIFYPSQEHAAIPLWLRAADVLILPNTGTQKVARLYTSPMKLFEYMASGRPIVASDIPSVREIVSDEEVFFAEADNPTAFAKQIRFVLDHPEEARRRSENAHARVQEFTWLRRAGVLGAHMERLLKVD